MVGSAAMALSESIIVPTGALIFFVMSWANRPVYDHSPFETDDLRWKTH